MKKILSFVAILALLLATACSQQYLTPYTPSTTPTTSISFSTTSTTQILTTTSAPLTTTLQFTTQSGVLDVHFIDVGEGDSILIDYGNTDILIDGGQYSGIVNSIKPYVHGDIEAVIATHPHADHIGGLTDVLESFKVDNVFWTGETDTTQTFINWKKAMDSSGATETIVKRGDVINEGSLTFDVLDPTKTTDSDIDQDCIVTSLQFGSQSFLFMGDDGQPAEDGLIAAGLLHQFDVLKVGHHGSDTASSQEFVNIVKPGYAIYECGLNDNYGFPKADVIAKLKASGALVYGTDVSGTITYETNGISAIINISKNLGK